MGTVSEDKKAARRAWRRNYQKAYRADGVSREKWIVRNREAAWRKQGILCNGGAFKHAHYDAFLAAQAGKCAACDQPFGARINVDHDHRTGEARGLLCSGCNCAAGYAKDDPKRLRQIADYLERHGR